MTARCHSVANFGSGRLAEFSWPVCPMAGCLFLFLFGFLLWVPALTAYFRVLYILHALRLLERVCVREKPDQ